MIKSWKLYNFKSVHRAELPMAPLTLFAGGNSSGKSTLLQSILLISQTLSSRVSTQTVLLNGHFVKLGQLTDLRPSFGQESQIRIGWDLVPIADAPESGLGLRPAPEVRSISGDISFGLVPHKNIKAAQLNPALLDAHISCVAQSKTEKREQTSLIRMKRRPTPVLSEEEETETALPRTLSWDFDVSMDDQATEYLRDEFPNGTIVGCNFQHFLPQWLVVSFDQKAALIKALSNVFIDPSGARRVARALTLSEIVIPSTIISFLRERAADIIGPLVSRATQKAAAGEPNVQITVADLIDHVRGLWPLRRARHDQQTLVQLNAELGKLAAQALSERRAVSTTGLPGTILNTAIDTMVDLFARNVRYLGPLREEPKSLFPLQITADPQDVGLHGEHTAAVLHHYQATGIEYIPSKLFEDNVPNIGRGTATTLRTAVFDWLAYLDIAAGVATTDEGKFGHGLSVSLSDSPGQYDLTHVGVGVSQVLPIVVMCLLARKGTTLIIEQPELHLNPKVQTRLADFFLSMALLGKQCLIETHSEYLINRLRLRAVIAEGSSLAGLIKLYFVEKHNGASHYRDVRINEFGAIEDWPAGFFDQSQREIEQLLLAASEKAKLSKTGRH